MGANLKRHWKRRKENRKGEECVYEREIKEMAKQKKASEEAEKKSKKN